jgi:hypothetical protein
MTRGLSGLETASWLGRQVQPFISQPAALLVEFNLLRYFSNVLLMSRPLAAFLFRLGVLFRL